MLYKLLAFLTFAVMATAAPGALLTRDARNCTFTTHITEKCNPQNTPTRITVAKISNLLTPSMSAVLVPDDEHIISAKPLSIHITSRNELIDGDLSIERLHACAAHYDRGSSNCRDSLDSHDGKVHFSWGWKNPSTHLAETVMWNEDDDGKATRYGCRYEKEWSKSRVRCDKVTDDQRDMTLSCFFKCRN